MYEFVGKEAPFLMLAALALIDGRKLIGFVYLISIPSVCCNRAVTTAELGDVCAFGCNRSK